MVKNLLTTIAFGLVSAFAFADDVARAEAKQTIEMKDGSTLFIFKDGKMAMQDKMGRPTRMKKGEVMETKDGQKVMMYGDEVMRLDSLSRRGHEGGG